VALAVAGTLWYVSVETSWLRRHLGIGTGAAARLAAWTFLKATCYFVVLTASVALLNR
jgi:hypothetical protein